ncbi:MAG: hypothetical protein HYR71_08720, partial [Chloroflexi bacterium]|nr:hypothetical protein [Chloroflexota bacterium]
VGVKVAAGTAVVVREGMAVMLGANSVGVAVAALTTTVGNCTSVTVGAGVALGCASRVGRWVGVGAGVGEGRLLHATSSSTSTLTNRRGGTFSVN